MILPLLRLGHVRWAGLLAACVASVACSSSNNPPPDAFMAAEVGGGVACPFPSPITTWLPVGTNTADKPTTVQDQGSTGAGTASVTCTVHPSGNGFDIALSVTVEGSNGGGGVTIVSPTGTGAVTTAGGKGITASFESSTASATFEDTNCAITFTYGGGPVSVSPPIAAGRIWGHITCPNAIESGGSTMTLPDGGAAPKACRASADFLFEQCSQ